MALLLGLVLGEGLLGLVAWANRTLHSREADTILAQALASHRPELVLILVGANNVSSSNTP